MLDLTQITRRLQELEACVKQLLAPKSKARIIAGADSSAKHAARLMASWSAKVAECQIYTLDGVALTYKETAEVYDPLSTFAALDTNDWMYCTLQGGKYYGADPGGCPGTSPLIASPPDTQP